MVASGRRVLLSATVCTAAAFGIGYISANDWYTFGQPGLLFLALPAAVLGSLSRRMFLGAAFAPVLGFAGAVGMMLRLSPHEEHFFVCVGVLTGLGGLVCVIAGALGGLFGDKKSDGS